MNDPSLHVIVLTRDRPETLRRCIQQMDLRRNDRLTVLDDSRQESVSSGRQLLSRTGIGRNVSHWETAQIFDALQERLPGQALEWTRRTEERDIAPLRNLSLLVSVCDPRDVTMLVDDDITDFDLETTRREVARIEEDAVVAGAHIGGTDEDDLIDRLAHAIAALEVESRQPTTPNGVQELFQTPPRSMPVSPEVVNYVSGGYLAFRLPMESLLAFPPGYNEDWLWCLEIFQRNAAKVYRLPQLVVHDPPCMKEVNGQIVRFELLGDLVCDLSMMYPTLLALDKINGQKQSSATRTLSDIPKEILPTTRVHELLARADQCSRIGLLNVAGLGLVRHLHDDKSLAIDWPSEVVRWRVDAENKRNSFALALTEHKSALHCLFDEKEVLT